MRQLLAEGIRSRVVSMPSWDIFEHQPQEYRDSVLPPDVTARVAVEQASTFGWERYVGDGRPRDWHEHLRRLRAAQGTAEESSASSRSTSWAPRKRCWARRKPLCQAGNKMALQIEDYAIVGDCQYGRFDRPRRFG